jgi:S-adenosylmethionine:tRNA ribosyltransferase-isomerase
MKTEDFFFDLPAHLIAQYPGKKRGQSRMMALDRLTGERCHLKVADLPDILCGSRFLSLSGEKPLLVFNDTKVRKARLIGKSAESGAYAEFLLLERTVAQVWKALARRAKRRKQGSRYVFYDRNGGEIASAEVTGREGECVLLAFDRPVDDAWLEEYGHIPLPPYIKRGDSADDAERYQTVYARHSGSAAAPTAGLHFTRDILDSLFDRGIESAFVTLHIGLGTFLPVRSALIEDHQMHEELFVITEENALIIEKAFTEKRKIIAVGTTSLRALESAFSGEGLCRGWRSTSIFISPGWRFKTADALFTNFHTPLSTLLMLVSAFADGAFPGRELILESYAEAVKEGYRFFSYGDAMLVF